MTSLKPGDQDEKPLDPAMEAVRRKMVRLMIVSGTVMVVSLMAVFGAIVYKAMRPAARGAVATGVPSEAPVSSSVALPAGFAVQSVSLSGNQMLFYGMTISGQRQAIVFDYGTGHVVATVSLPSN
jgi:hypothetical protein